MFKLKTINIRRPFSCDVLIFDEIGTQSLAHAVPEYASIGYLSTRFRFPILLSRNFLSRFIQIVIKHILHRTKSTYTDYLDALIGDIKPKVVITAADNNTALAIVSKYHKNILFCYIQSALRDIHSFPKHLKLPIYCSFGYTEKLLFRDLEVDCKEYLPIGSLKLGVALSTPKIQEYLIADLCFISSHRAEIPRSGMPTINRKIEDIDQILFKLLVKYANNRGLNIRLLGKAREYRWQKKEISHFERLSFGYPFEYIRTDNATREYSNYHALLKSNVAINCGSTLGFEALSLGRKVLFGATMDTEFLHQWGVDYYYSNMPELVRLESGTFQHFYQKLDSIRALPQTEFSKIINPYSRQIVNTCPTLKPHEYLQKRLEKHLLT
jgi:surface carbohydrate biosynthesis protein